MTELSPNSRTEMPADTSHAKARWKTPILCLLAGILIGAGIAAFVGWKAMPSMMLTVHESRYPDVARTCEELKKAIEANGWECPAIRDMNKSMAKHGVTFDPPYSDRGVVQGGLRQTRSFDKPRSVHAHALRLGRV